VATLYRPKVTTYRLKDGSYRTPDGKRVTSKTPGAVRHESRSKTWWGRYTDGAGEEHQVKLSTSKEIARRMLAKLAGDAQLASVGISDPFAEHRSRPLAGHLEDYGRYLLDKGDTEGHAKKTVSRCEAILDGCEATAIGDLQPSAVLEVLGWMREVPPRVELPPGQGWFKKAELVAVLGVHPGSVAHLVSRDRLEARGQGKARRYSRAAVEALQARLCRGAGISTTNHYLTAIKGFTRWLRRDGRAPADPLECLSRQNADADVRVERRSLEPAEFAALVRAARGGRPFRNLTGEDRATLYTLAAHTGLRASELASLTPRSFDFEAPTVTVEAAYSKRRRKDVLDLRPDLANMMRSYVEGKPFGEPLWPGGWSADGAEIIRVDLAAAGIPYLDAAGRAYDFHALRHQFISDLAAAGVHPKEAQALARHSTITLTMDRYAHVRRSNLKAALDRLPALPGQEAPQADAKRA
jgi:integrase